MDGRTDGQDLGRGGFLQKCILENIKFLFFFNMRTAKGWDFTVFGVYRYIPKTRKLHSHHCDHFFFFYGAHLISRVHTAKSLQSSLHGDREGFYTTTRKMARRRASVCSLDARRYPESATRSQADSNANVWTSLETKAAVRTARIHIVQKGLGVRCIPATTKLPTGTTQVCLKHFFLLCTFCALGTCLQTVPLYRIFALRDR